MSKECSYCNTVKEFCCTKSRAKHQVILDELASKNRQLEDLRREHEKLCVALREKHAINEELFNKLDEANRTVALWQKIAVNNEEIVKRSTPQLAQDTNTWTLIKKKN